MKTKSLLFILIAVFTTSFLSAKPPKNGKLTVAWTFTGIIEGYDHQNKIAVFIDGEKKGESTQKLESQPNSYTIAVPVGEHNVKIMNYAFYDGEWQEHTKENEYSLDCTFDQTIKIKKKTKITLVFDIDKEVTTSTVK